MKIFKKVFRYFFRFVLGIITFVLIYFFCSWLFPLIAVNSSFTNASNGIELFIQSNGIHTDIVLPVKSEQIKWNRLLPYADFINADSSFQYIGMGWGDRGFYLDTPAWSDLKCSTAFNAAFGLGETAMHVTYKYNKPVINERCKSVVISKDQYNLLVNYIISSFRLEKNKVILIDHAGYTQQDRFYEGQGTYNMFKTCNVWTGKGLKTAGIKIGIWTPFQGGIIDHIK